MIRAADVLRYPQVNSTTFPDSSRTGDNITKGTPDVSSTDAVSVKVCYDHPLLFGVPGFGGVSFLAVES